MVGDWNKLAAILEREDKEFRRVMEAEVSTVFSRFSSKYRILAGVDTITQHQIDPLIFEAVLSPLAIIVIKFTKFYFSLGIRLKHQWL